jgi:hypothetical protein
MNLGHNIRRPLSEKCSLNIGLVLDGFRIIGIYMQVDLKSSLK